MLGEEQVLQFDWKVGEPLEPRLGRVCRARLGGSGLGKGLGAARVAPGRGSESAAVKGVLKACRCVRDSGSQHWLHTGSPWELRNCCWDHRTGALV